MFKELGERYRRRQVALDAFIRRMPPRDRWQLAVAVFCCFAPIGLFAGVPALSVASPTRIAIVTLQSGVIALAYGIAGVSPRRKVLLPLAAVVHVAVSFAMVRWLAPVTKPATLDAAAVTAVRSQLTAIVIAGIVMTSLAYVMFVRVFQTVGVRYTRVETEMRLAAEIHASLAPAVEGRLMNPSIEWRGVSKPSGEVGGDLVDVIATKDGWLACVADVSGHGVRAGVLMGMFKAALRATDGRDAGHALSHINRTLGPLTQANMFVTVAIVRRIDAHTFEYVLAGHPPMLHIAARTGDATWRGESQLALGMFEEVTYRATRIVTEPGDLLVVVTDGLTEVFDRAGREFGQDGVRTAATSLPATAPLTDLEARLFESARRHGKQLDDQTALIVRT